MPDWSRIHEDRKFRVSYFPLALLSFVYKAAVCIKHYLFDNKTVRALPDFTISIGNLTAGGTGKTPATQMMAEWAAREGYSVAILSRGYGGVKKEKVSIVSDGVNILMDSKEAGDEAYLLASKLKGIPVIVSKDRYLGGLEAHKRFGSSFFILDDGYQHLKLKRDFNILLLDAVSPFGNGRLLPLGPLREPISGIKRADAIILTRAGSVKYQLDKKDGLGESCADAPIFTADHVPEKVVYPSENKIYPPEFLRGKRVAAFSGIARPDFFRETLISLGAEISSYRAFPDHHPFTKNEIESLISDKQNTGADLLITTEKDWMRAAALITSGQAAAYLTIKFDLINEKERFFAIIKGCVSKKIKEK
jgi:tetraacyldisaccharide 4'-kinase